MGISAATLRELNLSRSRAGTTIIGNTIGPGGSPLVYSTYFGGTNYDEGRSIAVDANGFVYVTGFTASTNFPTTNAVFQQLVWTNIEVTHSSTNYVPITNTWNGSLLNGSAKQTATFRKGAALLDLPPDIVEKTAAKYGEAWRLLTARE